MSNLIEIKTFNVLAGTDIREAVKEAIIIAIHYDCIVEFDFNSAKMRVYDFDTEQELADSYYRQINKNGELE